MSLSFILGNVAYALTAAAFIVRDILWLRVLGVLANFGFICANYTSRTGPNMAFVAWSALFCFINGVQIVLLVLERRNVTLPPEDHDLHAGVFPNLPVSEFRRLLSLGRRVQFAPGTVVVERGAWLDDVLVIESGLVSAHRDGHQVDQRGDGRMIGEVSFVADRPFSSKIVVEKSTRCVAWNRRALKRLFMRRPALGIGFHAAFIGSLELGAELLTRPKPEQT